MVETECSMSDPVFSKALVKIMVKIYAVKSTNVAKEDSARRNIGEGTFGISVPEECIFDCPPLSPIRAPNESSNNSTSTNIAEFESNSNTSFLIRLIRRINSTIFVFDSTIRRILEANISI
jgi:hypothetical protein